MSVSKGGHEHHVLYPSFETQAFGALLRMRYVGELERLYGVDQMIVMPLPHSDGEVPRYTGRWGHGRRKVYDPSVGV